jgi:hypothetical protein
LVQGRIFAALFLFVLAFVVRVISFGTLGWVIHIIAAVHAGVYDPDG